MLNWSRQARGRCTEWCAGHAGAEHALRGLPQVEAGRLAGPVGALGGLLRRVGMQTRASLKAPARHPFGSVSLVVMLSCRLGRGVIVTSIERSACPRFKRLIAADAEVHQCMRCFPVLEGISE